MIRRPPRSTRKESSAASDVYKRQAFRVHILRDFDVSARVWRLLMYVAWRLHSLVCNFFWFSLVCWGFVQGYLHRGCLCKRETRTVFANILSGMFLVAGAVQPSRTHGASYFGVYDFAFRDLEIRADHLRKRCVYMLFVLTISCLWAFAEPHFLSLIHI